MRTKFGLELERSWREPSDVGAEDALRELSEDQHGVVAVRQAYALGLSEAELRHRLDRGDWQRESSRVLHRVGAPRTDLTGAMRIVLHHGPDTYVSHEAALALWGLPGFYSETIHVISRRVRNRKPAGLGVVHSTTDLLDTQIADVRGVPIVTPIRAIFDIAGRVHPRRLERALDSAWARRLVSYALLHRTLDELATRGRPGIRILRSLAAERPPNYRPPDSNTERRFNEILARAGERQLRRQIHLGDQEHWVGRIDFVDDQLPFSVEIQSELFHGSVLDRRRDAERIAALRAGGHEVLEVWETEVWRDPEDVVRRVRDGRRTAAARHYR